MEIEISEGLYELLVMQSAESELTVEELISFVFGNYMEQSNYCFHYSLSNKCV